MKAINELSNEKLLNEYRHSVNNCAMYGETEVNWSILESLGEEILRRMQTQGATPTKKTLEVG